MDRAERERIFKDGVAEHSGMVARIVSAYEHAPAVQEELLQDAFAAFWKALPSFRRQSSLKTFLARISHNVAVSHVRRERRMTTVPIEEGWPDTAADPGERAARSVDRGKLLEAVRELPVGLRQVVTLHLEGFSDAETARALDLTTANVSVRLTRARAQLRARLREDGE